VHSFDFVAINDKVTACDMKNTGLSGDILDVVVLSLSLMGTHFISVFFHQFLVFLLSILL
jgi:ribosomal RNA-processing protein 8